MLTFTSTKRKRVAVIFFTGNACLVILRVQESSIRCPHPLIRLHKARRHHVGNVCRDDNGEDVARQKCFESLCSFLLRQIFILDPSALCQTVTGRAVVCYEERHLLAALRKL